jgi:hypothetical protein
LYPGYYEYASLAGLMDLTRLMDNLTVDHKALG